MTRDHRDEPLIVRKPPEPRTDWVAWSLQFALGFLVGSGVGVLIGSRMIRLYFIGEEEIRLVIAGIALFLGAIASYWGDDTWVMRSALDPERPVPSRKCRNWSTAVGGTGIAFVAYAVVHHLSTVGWKGGHFSLSVFEVILVLLGCLLAYLLVRAIRTGTTLWVLGGIERDEAPFQFWLWFASASLGVLFILVRLI